MVKEELIKRSPLRVLEHSIHGGLEPGNIGVLAAPKGTGKTACLVHIATDKLFQEKHVIHVSFSGRTDHIISWYEDIFSEIARKRNLESAMTVHDQIIKNRVIMNFSQEGVTAEQLLTSLRAMIGEGQFAADAIIVDGYEFEKGKPETFEQLQAFAREMGLVVWVSASVYKDGEQNDANGVPQVLVPFIDYVSVLITLASQDNHVKLALVKDHDKYCNEDLHLELDSRTLLIREE